MRDESIATATIMLMGDTCTRGCRSVGIIGKIVITGRMTIHSTLWDGRNVIVPGEI